MSEPVERLSDAKIGDVVCVYNSEQSRFDNNKKYVGRGVWTTAEVKAIGRKYLTAGSRDHDRKTGRGRTVRGYTTGDMVAGRKDRDDRIFLDANRYAAVDRVMALSDADKLRAIIEILDAEPQS